jgi:hypothetical protein
LKLYKTTHISPLNYVPNLCLIDRSKKLDQIWFV